MPILRAADVEAEIAPAMGGGLARLRWRGLDILRPAPPDPSGPEQLSCFPLVPFANRIDRGRFAWRGQDIRLTPGHGDARHPLHGHGWVRPWTPQEIGPAHAILDMRVEPGDWPWAYTARQTIRLEEDGISLRLDLTNTGEAPMPAGVGFHPYFPDRGGARLTARVDGVWLTDADNIPARLAPADRFADWSRGAGFPHSTLIDHCHGGWTGEARLDWPVKGLTVRMTGGANLRWLHVYAPTDADFFCLEPVSHRPDALNAPSPRAEGVVALPPGRTLSGEMRIAAGPTEA